MKKALKQTVSVFIAFCSFVTVLCCTAFAADNFNIITMRPGVDNNSFNNSEADFIGENEKSKYYITAIELNKLVEGESEDTKNLILSQALSKFDGACYGISATMALSYTGRIDLPKSNYYAVNLKEDTFFKKRINYYQLAQYCENKNLAVTRAVSDGKISEDSLKQIVEYAKSGTLFLITFKADNIIHTVVACGYEYGSDGTHRIRILDCNKKDDFMFLSVSAGYDLWRFDNSDYETEKISDLYFSTLDVFTPFSFKNDSKTVYSAQSSSAVTDTVCAGMSSVFTLTNSEGQTLKFDKGEITGDIEADVLKYISNSNDALSSKVVFTIEDSNEYTVTNEGEGIDLTVVGDNGLFFALQGKNIKTITASEGKTCLEGENMEYAVSIFSEEENVDMINICGADPDKITFTVKDGATLSDAENGKIHASIISYGQLYETDFELNHKSFSIYYSDVVKTNHVSGKGSPVAKTVILVFVAVVFTVTLVFTVKKRKNKTVGKKGA